jgi:hypothetical protein
MKLLASCLMLATCLVACSKAPSGPQPAEINGVKVDVPKLQAAFANSSPEVMPGVTAVMADIRYGKYPEAVAELEKLSTNPNLNDAQKKAVADVLAQMKQVASKPPAAPAP